MFSRTSSRALLASKPRVCSLQSPHVALPAFTQTRSATRLEPRQSLHFRQLHTTPVLRKGITPGSSDPAPPSTEPKVAGGARHVTEAAALTEEQYREYSEHYFNTLLSELERRQEEGSDIEAEYSVSHSHHHLFHYSD